MESVNMFPLVKELAKELKDNSESLLSEYESVDLAIKMFTLKQNSAQVELLKSINQNLNYINKNIHRR